MKQTQQKPKSNITIYDCVLDNGYHSFHALTINNFFIRDFPIFVFFNFV